MGLLLNLLTVACGGLIFFVALLVVIVSDKREVSLRTIAAGFMGVGGAALLGVGLTGEDASRWLLLCLPIGVALWLFRALRRSAVSQVPMRRASDFMGLDEGALEQIRGRGRT